MANQELPQDLEAARMAAPTERHEIASNPFQTNGVGFQGSPAFEPFETGQDYQGLASLNGFPSGVSIGGLDSASLYPVANPFPDQHPAYQVTGYDTMRGITYPAIPVSFSNEKVYWDGVQNEVVGFHDYSGNAQPELQSKTTTE
jgi:hypothetical protein